MVTKRVAIYARVSTGEQTTANQLRELRAWAKNAGHEVVKVFEDKGISGTKGRDKRPGFDAMLKAATRREFDTLAVWSSDRIGRSMPDLLETLQTIRGAGLGLYLHTQALDTSTPAGRALYQMLGVFAELEGLARAKANGTKSGKAIGRPRKASDGEIRAQLTKGTGILRTATLLGCGTSTVHKVAKAMRA
jgi:DNA invertase Pin-like site-specific DNA recombinase